MSEPTKNKLLTISIAAYNVADFIENTLSSLLIPELDDIEVLIVDDGATDSTADLAEAFAAEHGPSFRVIRKENGGYGTTVMRSISEAKGTYFRLLDGDDWYDKDGLSALLNILQSTEADLVITPWIRQQGPDAYIKDICLHLDAGEYDLPSLDLGSALAMHGATFRTELLRNANINLPSHCLYTDILYVSQALQHTRTVRITHIPVYHYRLGVEGQSVDETSRLRHADNMTEILGKLATICASYTDASDARYRMTADLTAREADILSKVLFRAPVSNQMWEKIQAVETALAPAPEVQKLTRSYAKNSALLSSATSATYRPIATAYRAAKKAKNALQNLRG